MRRFVYILLRINSLLRLLSNFNKLSSNYYPLLSKLWSGSGFKFSSDKHTKVQMLIQLLALLQSAEHVWEPIKLPISLLPHAKSCQECSSCIFSLVLLHVRVWCRAEPKVGERGDDGWGPEEVPSLRAQAAIKSSGVTQSLPKEFKST